MIYRYGENMGGNPATVDITNGIVYINRDVWQKLDDYEKAVILLHEEGHYCNKSVDEIKADAYAIEQYLSESNTPERRKELLQTIFRFVPDEQRKVEFVRQLLAYDANNGNDKSHRLLVALDDATPVYANSAGAAIVIVDLALKLGAVALNFWEQQRNKATYWRDYSGPQKEEIIEAASRAAIINKFNSSGGDLSATLLAAQKPYGDTDSIYYDTFNIIAQGVVFDRGEFDNLQQITASEASAIWWPKQGYQFTWMQNKVKEMEAELNEYWRGLDFFSKVKYSTRYKLYVLMFIVIAVFIWKY